MVSEKRLAANRANAKKSTGPRTTEGKQRSAMNAVRHGLCAKTVCVHGEESADFNALVAAFVDEHRPASATEYSLVYRMAVASWNLRRLAEAETASIDACTLHKAFENGAWVEKRLPIGEAMLKAMKDDKRFNALQLYQQRTERAFYRALAELRRVRKDFEQRPDADVDDVVDEPDRAPIEMTDPHGERVSSTSIVSTKQIEQTKPTPISERPDFKPVPPLIADPNQRVSTCDPRYPLSAAHKRMCNESLRARGLPTLPMDRKVLPDGTILPD